VFRTDASDITGQPGAVIYDRGTGTTSAVTVDTSGGDAVVGEAWLSGDGRWIAFDSNNAGIVPGDDNAAPDVFLMNRATGQVILVSRAADGGVADGPSFFTTEIAPIKPYLSRDGSRVLFLSRATDLVGSEDPSGGQYSQAYVFDVATGVSELATVMSDGTLSDDLIYDASISPDGRYVAMSTQAFLTGGGGVLGPKAYVRDLRRDQTRAASDGRWAWGAGLGGHDPVVVFATRDALVPEDTDGDFDSYYRTVW
jgi:Tol biopolymer transport system component